jgi:hypothetical protein
MIPGLNKTQTLAAMAMLKLVTRGDMPESDWKFLYAQFQTLPMSQKPETRMTFEEFKAKLKGEAPAFLYDLLHKPKSPPPLDHSQN